MNMLRPDWLTNHDASEMKHDDFRLGNKDDVPRIDVCTELHWKIASPW